MIGGSAPRARFTFDSANDVVDIDQRGVRLHTKADIDAHFDAVLTWSRKRFAGKKAIFVVSFEDFEVNLRESDYYAKRLKGVVDEIALATVRYGGSDLQRTAVRLRSVKVHTPSHLCATREEALEIVRRLRVAASELEPSSERA